MAHRILDHPILGELPPARTVTITIDGREINAREGESMAAALMVNGIRVFRTMPKTGEARGGYCMIGRCSDCLMKVDGVLNVRVCITQVKEGMRVQTQHGLGEFDREVEL